MDKYVETLDALMKAKKEKKKKGKKTSSLTLLSQKEGMKKKGVKERK